MLPSFATEIVTVVKPGRRTSRHGPDVADWSPDAVTVVTVPGCTLQPSDTADVSDPAREATSSRWLLLAPPGSPIAAEDRVRLDAARDLQVVGEPQAVPSATGGLDHLRVLLRRVEG